MKKYLILFGLLGMVRETMGDEKIGQFGLEIVPGFSCNRIYAQRDRDIWNSDGGGFRLSVGGKYNFHLQEHIDLSTGLFLLPKEVSMKGSIKETNSEEKIRESHTLWYLQIPILCKFYTNDILLDTKIYFKLGIAIAGFLHDRTKMKELQDKIFMAPRPFVCSGILGVGIKYDFSLTTAFLVGLSYQYDIFGIVKKQYTEHGTVWCHNDFVGLDLGIVF